MINHEYYLNLKDIDNSPFLNSAFGDRLYKEIVHIPINQLLLYLKDPMRDDHKESLFPTYTSGSDGVELSSIDFITSMLISELRQHLNGDDLIRVSYMLKYNEVSSYEYYDKINKKICFGLYPDMDHLAEQISKLDNKMLDYIIEDKYPTPRSVSDEIKELLSNICIVREYNDAHFLLEYALFLILTEGEEFLLNIAIHKSQDNKYRGGVYGIQFVRPSQLGEVYDPQYTYITININSILAHYNQRLYDQYTDRVRQVNKKNSKSKMEKQKISEAEFIDSKKIKNSSNISEEDTKKSQKILSEFYLGSEKDISELTNHIKDLLSFNRGIIEIEWKNNTLTKANAKIKDTDKKFFEMKEYTSISGTKPSHENSDHGTLTGWIIGSKRYKFH